MKTQRTEPDLKKTCCLACTHILSLQRPVLYVAHDNDGTWKFICRHISHKITDVKTVSLQQITRLDASLTDLLEMPPGVCSQRTNTNNTWEPFLLYPDIQEE